MSKTASVTISISTGAKERLAYIAEMKGLSQAAMLSAQTEDAIQTFWGSPEFAALRTKHEAARRVRLGIDAAPAPDNNDDADDDEEEFDG